MQIYPATPLDAPQLTTLFLTAFSNPTNHAMFPRTADVQAWWEAIFQAETERMQQGKAKMLWKVVESSAQKGEERGEGEGEIVAFALWKLPGDDAHEDDAHAHELPRSADKDLCQRFFTGMARNREKYMSSRLHYCILLPLSRSVSRVMWLISCRPRDYSDSPRARGPWVRVAAAALGVAEG